MRTSGGLTYDASNKNAKAKLSFYLRPRDSFRFTSENVSIDILTEQLTSWNVDLAKLELLR